MSRVTRPTTTGVAGLVARGLGEIGARAASNTDFATRVSGPSGPTSSTPSSRASATNCSAKARSVEESIVETPGWCSARLGLLRSELKDPGAVPVILAAKGIAHIIATSL